MNSKLITSTKNPRVKQVIELRERRQRERAGLTRVEGYDEIRYALEYAKGVTLLYCPAMFRPAHDDALLETFRARGGELIEVNEAVFDKMAYREGADGWLAIFPVPDRPLEAISLRDPALVVVMDAVEKPGNLGAILRTAEAAGVDALVSADLVTDWGNPNVIRASKGAVYGMPVARAGSAETIAWLQAKGIRIVVGTPEATLLYTDADLASPVAVVVGAENQGVAPVWLERAEVEVRIPMFGRMDSLNVATSAALIIYEVVRQRHLKETSPLPKH